MKNLVLSLNNSSALNGRHAKMVAGLALSIAGAASNAFALPTGADVVSGQVAISQSNPNTLNIHQSTDKAVINWQNFDILGGETTNIIQPGRNSIQLDRVVGGDPTKILGNLNANGQVWIVNGNGVFFGQNAQVNVGGLIASTADISNENFNAGNYKFDRAGRADASIINKGSITAADGGLVALVAPGVKNDGVITAKYGTAQLGAGETFTMDFYGDNLYSFAIDSKATRLAKDENGNDLTAAITNNGTISAKGGTVYVTARAAKEMVDQAINTTGIIDATAAHVEGGTIVLDGGEGATVVSGTLDASGKGAGQKGGKAIVLGDYTDVTETAKIDVSGTTAGGFVETSGNALNVQGTVDASSTEGQGGEWLLDPNNITISNVNTNSNGNPNFTSTADSAFVKAGTIENALNGGTNVSVTTGTAGASSEVGNINVLNDITKNAGNNAKLTLNAHNDITIGTGVTIKSTNNKLNVVLNANSDNTGGGAIIMQSGSKIKSNGGDITFGGGGLVSGLPVGAATGNATSPQGILLDNAQLISDGGDIKLTGTAYSGAGVGNLDGILLRNGSLIDSKNGNITLTGIGGAGNTAGISYGNTGVYLREGSTITAKNGNININGTGGDGPASYNAGVALDSGAKVESTGTGASAGNINITGQGGQNSFAGYGVSVETGTIASVDGDVTITGTAGNGVAPSIYNDGVVLWTSGAVIGLTGDADLTITGTAGAGGSDIRFNNNTIGSGTASGTVKFNADTIFNESSPNIQTSGKVVFSNRSANTSIGIAGGAGTLQVTQDMLDHIIAPTVTIGSTTAGLVNAGAFNWQNTLSKLNIKSGGDVALSGITKAGGDAELNVTAGNGISVNAGSAIGSTSGKLDITFDADADANNSGGIVLNSGSSLTSNGGNIVLGGGLDPLTGAAQGNGATTLSLYGGEIGVYVNNATVNAGTGNITVNGTGGDNAQSVGVQIEGTGKLQTTSGNITVNGTGVATVAPGSYGIDLTNGGSIATDSGDIVLTGTGGNTGSSYGNGVQLYNGSSVTSNSGDITLNGTAGGTAGNFNFGIFTVAGNNVIGGATATGKITLNAGSDAINMSNATVQTAGDVKFDTTNNITMTGSTVSGYDINIDPANVLYDNTHITAANDFTLDPAVDVSLINGSTIDAGNNLIINNSGAFSSTTAGVLTANFVSLNQHQPGSIQNAINAISASTGSSILTLGSDTWNENINIGLSNFTLTGQGATSIIKPAAAPGSAIIYVHDNVNDTIQNIALDGSLTPLATGILAFNTTGLTIQDVGISDTGTAIDGFANNNDVTVHHNTITDTLGNVITLNGGAGADITDNTITNNGSTGIGINIFGNTGDVTITGNTITNTALVNSTAILLTSSTGTNVIGDGTLAGANTIDNYATGISDINSGSSIAGNTIDHASNRAINVAGPGAHTTSVTGNTIDHSNIGVNLTGSAGATVSDNTILNVGLTGIDASVASNNLTINNNTISGATLGIGTGINLTGLTNVHVGDGNAAGANANDIGNLATGVNVAGGSDIHIDGNNFSGLTANGVRMDGVSNATINSNVMDHIVTGGSSGIFASNGGMLDISHNSIDDTGLPNYGTNGIHLTNINNSTLDDNYVTYITNGINIDGNSTKISVTGSDIYNVTFAMLVANSSKIDITDSMIDLTYQGIGITGSDKVTVDNATITQVLPGSPGLPGIGVSATGSSNIVLKNSDITGNAGSVYGVYFDSVTGTNKIVDTGVHGFATGISATNGTDTTIKHNNITGVTATGIYATNISNLVIHNNTITDPGLFGIQVGSSDGALVTNNTVDDFNTGIRVTDSDNIIATGNTLTNIYVDGITLSDLDNATVNDNAITGSGGLVNNGISLFNVTNSDIGADGLKNTVKNFASGIKVSGSGAGSSYNTIAFNTLENNTTGVFVTNNSNHITVDSNKISGGTTGISVTNSADDVVSNNVLTAIGQDAISANAAARININNNTIKADGFGNTGAGGYGINVTGSGSGINVSDNTIKADNLAVGTGNTGIRVTGSNSSTISGNKIKADNGATGTQAGGISVTGNNEQVTGNIITADNGATGTSGVGITVSGTTNTVSGNEFKADHASIASNANGINVTGNTATVSGNIFTVKNSSTGANGIGISVASSTNAQVTGNEFYVNSGSTGTTGNAINVNNSGRANVSGNRIDVDNATGSLANGINVNNSGGGLLTGNGVIVENNILTATNGGTTASQDGIRVTLSGAGLFSGNDASVSGNHVDHVGDDGIDITTTSSLNVDGNTVDLATGSGIALSALADFDVTGNTVSNSAIGLELNAVASGTVGGFDPLEANTFTNNGIGISGNAVALVDVLGNEFADNNTGISFTNSVAINIEGNNINDTIANTTGISVADSDFITVDNNTLKGVNVGVLADNVDNLDVVNNTIKGLTTGIDITDSDGAYVFNNTVKNFITGVDIDNSDDAIVDDNKINGVVSNGLIINESDNALVTSNKIEAATTGTGTGILLTNVTNSHVGGDGFKNTITGFGLGANLLGSGAGNSDILVDFNKFENNTSGISITGVNDSITVDSNKITGTVDTGVYANGATNLVITNNLITDPGVIGINVMSSDGAIIDTNTVDDFQTGINVYDSDNVSVRDNTLTTIANTGIGLTALNNANVHGNTVEASGANSSSVGISLFNVTNSFVGEDGNKNKVSDFGTGIKVSGSGAGSSFNLIAFNKLEDNTTGVSVTNNSHHTTVDSNKVSGGTTGISITSSADNVVSNNKLTNIGTDAIFGNNATRVNIHDNTISADGTGNFGAGRYGINVQNSTGGIQIRDNEILADNGAHGTNNIGIRVSNSAAAQVTGNDIIAKGSDSVGTNGNGINVTGSARVNVSGNLVKAKDGATGSLGDAIFVSGGGSTLAGNGVVVDNNTITADSDSTAATGDGIRIVNSGRGLFGGNNASVSGNQIDQVNGDGIDITTTSFLDVDGNTVKKAGGNGIVLSTLANFDVTGNTVEKSGIAGLNLLAVASGTVGGFGPGDANTFSKNPVGVNGAFTGLIDVLGNNFDNNNTGISFTTSAGINIEGNQIHDTIADTTGVNVTDSSFVTVDSNVMTGVNVGVYANNVSGLAVTDNSISDPGAYGVHVIDSDGAFIDGNTIFDMFNGIRVDSSDNVNVTNNTLYDIFVDGIAINDSDNATVNGNSVTAGSGADNGIVLTNVTNSQVGDFGIDEGNSVNGFNRGILITDGSFNIEVANNVLTDNTTGIRVRDGSDSITLDTNDISGGTTGIRVTDGDDIDVKFNTLTNIGRDAIRADDVTSLNIQGNTISADGSGNTGAGRHGIYVTDSFNAQVYDNDVRATNGATGTGGSAIRVEDSDSADIYDNLLAANGLGSLAADGNGIRLIRSDDATVTGNVIRARNGATGVDGDGIRITRSDNVLVDNNTIRARSGSLAATGNGISVINSEEAVITNNLVRATGSSTAVNGDGIFVDNSGSDSENGKGVVVTNNRVIASANSISALGNGITVNNSDATGTGNLATVSFNTVNQAEGHGIVVTDTDNLMVDTNTVDAVVLDGIRVLGGANVSITNNLIGQNDTVGGNGITINSLTDGSIVSDNTIDRVGGNGIDASGNTGLTIASNDIGTMAGSGSISLAGIYVSGDTDVTINDTNTINNADTGIAVTGLLGTLNTIADNVIDAITNDGIDVVDSTNVTVSGNSIGTNFGTIGGIGIFIDPSNNVTVSGNTVNNADTGISLIDVTGTNSVTGNFIDLITNNAIEATNVNDLTISGNEIGQNPAPVSGDDPIVPSIGGNGIVVSSLTGTNLIDDNLIDSVVLDGIVASLIGGGESETPDTITISNNEIGQNAGLGDIGGNGITVSSLIGDNFITGNTIDRVGANGIDAANDTALTIDGNAIGTTAGSGSITGTGIFVDGDTDVTINGTNTINNASTGVTVTGLTGTTNTIADNIIDNIVNNGVNVIDSTNVSIDGNDIGTGVGTIGGIGIFVDPSSNISVTGNTVNNADTGISLLTVTGTNTVSGNFLDQITNNAIEASNVSNLTISDNDIGQNPTQIGEGVFATSVGGNGIFVENLTGTNLIDGNLIDSVGNDGIVISDLNQLSEGSPVPFSLTVSNNVIGASTPAGNNGISVFNSDNVQFATNTITGDGTGIGVLVSGSDNVSFSGDSILNNAIGIQLDNAQDTTIDDLTLTDNGIHLLITNGSGGTLVSSTDFTGGTVGVQLDGEGSEMQFGDNDNSFTGMTAYFVLQNGAMAGQVLDASGQTFDGVEAADFDIDALIAAENKTIDLNDGFAVGDVFYKAFPNGFDLSLLNQALENNSEGNAFLTSLFSYAGQTIAGTTTEISYRFNIEGVNLSLLSQGNQPATFAISADQFGNLAPAAGGDANKYANLEPAAGGANQDCGNGFLGAGYTPGYNAGSCSAQ